ncbi:MAG: hypothetical protein LBH43_19290 [Treponema sp.]|jgi:hypothetical protein|nr:hypothetical protein [Treponema sp.]
MKHNKFFAFYVFIITASIFQTACELEYVPGYGFNYELQGAWLTNDYNTSKYYGCLEIDHDTIKITGYGENQTGFWEDDSQRPFKDNLKEWPVKGYSVIETKTSDYTTGQIFIQNGGVFPEEGIPYRYWSTTINSPNYQRVHFLRFNFGGRDELLTKTQ